MAALIKRVKGFIKLRVALNALQGALPDASTDEILAYNDECAICKVRVFVLLVVFTSKLSDFQEMTNYLICRSQWPLQRSSLAIICSTSLA